MALEGRDLAILSARFGVMRFGAFRFGFCPEDVEGAASDEPGEYIWKEDKPPVTAWTLQNPCSVCPTLCVAAFTIDVASGNKPLTVTSTDNSTGDITYWYWSFGDGGSSTEQNPVHIYASAGTFTARLWVSGPGGSDGPAEDTITVTTIPPPVAGFTWSWGAEQYDCSFNDTSSEDVTDWSWDFSDGPGDPSVSVDPNPTTTYPDWASHNVVLTVTGPGGIDTASATVTNGGNGSGT